MNKEDEARIKAYMAAKMAHIKMYNECMNLADGLDVEKFAELVRADEREKVAQWMIERGFATGHGDTVIDLLEELEWQAKERERNACAKVCDGISEHYETRTDLNQSQKQVGQLAAEVCGVRIRGNDLQTAIERGTKAWADVPDASEWVEELRGNDKPPVKTYAGGKPNYCTPEETPEVPCKTHPDAPHGFDRNASHSADRYVCECEGWEPPKEKNT